MQNFGNWLKCLWKSLFCWTLEEFNLFKLAIFTRQKCDANIELILLCLAKLSLLIDTKEPIFSYRIGQYNVSEAYKLNTHVSIWKGRENMVRFWKLEPVAIVEFIWIWSTNNEGSRRYWTYLLLMFGLWQLIPAIRIFFLRSFFFLLTSKAIKFRQKMLWVDWQSTATYYTK